jgi:pimeloyl-ACP methyl ester carboxylesterase
VRSLTSEDAWCEPAAAAHDRSRPWRVCRVGDLDQSIPAAALRAMAERAGARQMVELAGASHALAVSRAAETAEVILRASA